MIIQEDFSHKIIIYASGEIQIKMLLLIYKSINTYYNKKFIMGGCIFNNPHQDKVLLEFLESRITASRSQNINPCILYIPNELNSLSFLSNGEGTIFIKNKLESFYKYNTTIEGNHWIENVSKKINLKSYKLVNMLTVFQLYGKYLFNNKESLRDHFLEKYSSLSDSPVYQSIKNINF